MLCLDSMERLALPDSGVLGVTVKELGLVSLRWMLPLVESVELVLFCLEMAALCLSRSLAAISRANGEAVTSFPLGGSLVFRLCSLLFSKGLYFVIGFTGVA